MAKLPRFNVIGQPQHVIVRGNNREPIFYADEDYFFYLEKLQEASQKHECDIHAYVLMTNHVHLLVTPNKPDGLSKMMQMIGRYYVQYFNYNYKRTGTLWEGRYKATLIDSEHYALTCYRYIELNPVRAQMVNHPAEYPWSSYRDNGLKETNDIIPPHSLYESLDNTEEGRAKMYRQLFDEKLEQKELTQIRESTNKAWVLSSDYFKEKIAKQLNRATAPKAKGGDR